MKVCGIICEYNPFHNGHIHHIQETKKLVNPDLLVCVMSGNFVQRGECAITDKWKRAKCAIENGVDLVLELPYIYATQSATQFAKGSIDILKLAHVDTIVFGSECNDIDKLKEIANIDTSYINQRKENKISTAKAYAQLYGTFLANDILGINYLREIKNTNIKAYTIQRTNNYHEEDLNKKYSSATSIRKAILAKKDVSKDTCMSNITELFYMELYFPLIRTLLLTTPKEVLSTYFLMDEGIENNLIKNIKIANSYEEFISLCVSKRYTKAKIQRTLLHMLTQTTKEEVNALPPLSQIRILAFNEKGQKYLKELKKQDVNIASRFKQILEPYKSMELKASYVYAYPLSVSKQKEWLKKELQPPIFISTLNNNDINK